MISKIIETGHKVKISKFEYFLILLVFITTASPFFSGYKPLKLLIAGVLIVLYVKRNNTRKFDMKFYFVFYTYLLIALIQGVIWDFSFVALITSFLITMLIPYLLFILYGVYFLTIIERIIFVFSVISLVFFTLQIFFPILGTIFSLILGILEPFNSDEWGSRSLIIYTYRNFETSIGIGRNSGFSHEPGGFATILVLGIVINFANGLSLLCKRNIVYYIAIITTFSTAGYFSLAVFALLLIRDKKNRLLATLLFPIILLVANSVYSNLDFMSDKVNEQFAVQSKSSLTNETSGRILGARKSINVLLKHPFYGRGLLSVSKPNNTSDSEYADYGWLSYVSHYGIIFGAMFMYYFFKGIWTYLQKAGLGFYEFIVLTLAIMVNLSAQVFINHVYFMIFFFMGLCFKNVLVKNKQISVQLKSYQNES